jgi:hypothetical protein
MMRLARDLGYTLTELTDRITYEELQLWGLMYQVEFQESKEASEKAARRRM